jgi:hypothetical protein
MRLREVADRALIPANGRADDRLRDMRDVYAWSMTSSTNCWSSAAQGLADKDVGLGERRRFGRVFALLGASCYHQAR